MDNLSAMAKELYESINYAYFVDIAKQINYCSERRDEEKRLKLGAIYNGLQGIKYKIKHLNLSAPDAREQLENFAGELESLKKQYKILMGVHLSEIVKFQQ